MKFAKLFQQVLTDEHLPEEWVNRAIQYKKLKKRINKVVDELNNIGINENDLIFNYNLEIKNNEIHPLLSIKITPLIRSLIVEKLDNLNYNYEIKPINNNNNKEEDDDINDNYSAINPFDDSKPFYELKISLLEDTRFFQILYDEIEDLNNFENEKENEIINKVENIANEVSIVTIPDKKKTDLYLWREIFQLYIESEIFFSTIEKNAGNVDINLSKEKYFKFLNKLQLIKIEERFNQKNSILALNDFKNLNFQIIKISNYQNFNNLAVKKILKKFDKQTQLNSKNLFPKLILDYNSFNNNNNNNNNNLNILDSSIAKDICFIISNKLLSIVPQIDDYLCPICCSIAFKPIRLKCGHLFCIRCLVKLRRRLENKCPLCRNECLLSLTVDDLDIAQMNYMKMYFPNEVRQKIQENDKEILEEQYGPQKPCIIS
jgi:E3 ubiquitin-protein ligase BAH